MGQPEIVVAFRFAIDQRGYAKSLGKSFELSGRRRSFDEVDEMSLYTPFGEEAECLTSVGVLLDAENLNFHRVIEGEVVARAS